MNGKAIKISSFVLGTWLLFRFISDWPRGANGSGIYVDDYLTNLSYAGLVAWLAMAVIGLLAVTNFYKVLFSDRIARAHIVFICFQFFGLYIISRDFGNDGLIAGCYIIMVAISFLLTYLLGIETGRLLATETVDQGSRRFLRWITLCLAPCMVIGALQLLTGTGRDVGGIPRIYGGTSSPNVLAALLLVYLGMLFWTGDREVSNVRKGWIAFALALFVACFSMSGFVAIIAMSGLFWLVNGLKTGRMKMGFSTILGTVLAIAVIGYLASNILTERLAEFGQSDNSLTWRTRTWMSYLDLLSKPEFILMGGGLGFDHLGTLEEPHNEWLRVLLETGIIGLSLFIWTWWALVRSLLEIASLPNTFLQRRAIGMIAIVGGIAIWAMVDSVIRTAPSALLLWGGAGVLVGTARSYYQNAARRSFPSAEPKAPFAGGGSRPIIIARGPVRG